jgi:hypothetical protein
MARARHGAAKDLAIPALGLARLAKELTPRALFCGAVWRRIGIRLGGANRALWG